MYQSKINQSSSNIFRADINALRALAVTFVVLFHFQAPFFNAGYYGVDVFFVISGFLMADIISRSQKGGRFSLTSFWLARARRTWPAYLVMLAGATLVAAFVLLPDEFSHLGRHLRNSAHLTSNHTFLGIGDYFSPKAETIWFLHTWSLSVEWQFYLIYPLICLGLARLRDRHVLWVIGVTAIASLVAAMVVHHFSREIAFYILPTRMWEMLIGSFIALSGLRAKNWQGLAGLAVIFAIFMFGADTWNPVFAALVCVATASLIAARSDFGVYSWKPVSWLGATSYSLYLWHWPIWVYLAYLGLEGSAKLFTALGLTLILGGLSWHLVERPTQSRLSKIRPIFQWAILFVAMILVVALGQSIRKGILTPPYSDRVLAIMAEMKNTNGKGGCKPAKDGFCHFGGPDTAIAIIGDSHAPLILSAVQEIVGQDIVGQDKGVKLSTIGGCPQVTGFKSARLSGLPKKCEERVNQGFELADNIPVIFNIRATMYWRNGRSGSYFVSPDESRETYRAEFEKGYIDTICRLSERHPVYLVSPFPEMPFSVPHKMARMDADEVPEYFITRAQFESHRQGVMQLQTQVAQQCNAKIIDFTEALCDDKGCKGQLNGLPLYSDDNHLTEGAAPLLKPILKEALGR